MGYQESIIKINNQNKFGEIITYLKDKEKDLNLFISIYSVMTFNINVKLSYSFINNVSFKTGEKCICIGGERFANNNLFIFKDNPKLSKYSLIVPIEDFFIVNSDKRVNLKPISSDFEEKLKYWLVKNTKEIKFKNYDENKNNLIKEFEL